ncbi:tail assembly protein [Shimia sediminis]|uniref:tail assembly protein n=1 Tax=Shimia sediminis TaxID=2497945 RepID=UPI000F8C9263|nr:tail assembly protein [Shimia sediminis]
MRKVYLHGALTQHGECHSFDVLTAGDAIAALVANFPPIMEDLRKGSWVILRGDPETGIALDEDAVAGMQLGDADLHIMPEIVGAKNGNGALKAILGVALIAITAGGAAPFLANPIMAGAGATWSNAVGQMGVAMALTGVSQMLAPEHESADEEKSYTFTGPVSSHGQGQPIPVVYGEVITGGVLVSGGIDADGLESVTEAPVESRDPSDIFGGRFNWSSGPQQHD